MSSDTAAASRTATDRLEDFKLAIDRHLEACANRSGEGDPRVQGAYDDVREAAEAYDDALYDAYGEVTPFEFPDIPAEPVDPANAPDVGRVAIVLRRDYAVRDTEDLLASARSTAAEQLLDGAEGDGDDDARDGDHGDPRAGVGLTSRAIYALVQAAGVDGFDEIAEDAGLDPLGGTLWVVATDDDEDLFADPFDLDEDRLLHRVDEVVEL